MACGKKVFAFMLQVNFSLDARLTFFDGLPFFKAYFAVGCLLKDGVGYPHGANNAKYDEGNLKAKLIQFLAICLEASY